MKEQLQIRAGAEGFAAFFDQSGRRIAPHHHEELEVNLVLTGKASYLFGQRRVPLLAGSMIWLFPQQEHVLMDWSNGFSMWVVVFRQKLVNRYAAKGVRSVLRSPDPGDIFCRQIEPRRADLLHQVYQGAVHGNADLEFTNAVLGYALVASWQAYQFSGESISRADLHPAVAKAARLISAADVPASLAALANKSGLSAGRLSRLFKQQMGIGLTEFRQRKAVERFLRLYQEGVRHTLIEAALLAGFGSYAQFHRVFCRVMRMNPATYRKRLAIPVEAANPTSRRASTRLL